MDMSRIEQNGKMLETNFSELGLSVVYKNGVESALGDTYLFDLVNIAQYNENYLKSLIKKIAVYHHLDMSLMETKQAHFGVFVKQDQTTLSLAQLHAQVNYREIVIGKDINNNLVKIDFKKIPHLLIAGTTGSGKSVLLHNLICNIYNYYGQNRFLSPRMIIVDPKTSELSQYKDCRNTTFIDNVSQAIYELQECVSEMERRYRNAGVIESEMFIIIDELADLMLSSRFEVEESIVKIAQKGRACGMHLIVATQRPTIDVCSGLIKANMPYRIALKTASVRDSVVILDHKGAETLNGNGDSIVKLGMGEIRMQVAMASSQVIAKICQVYKGW